MNRLPPELYPYIFQHLTQPEAACTRLVSRNLAYHAAPYAFHSIIVHTRGPSPAIAPPQHLRHHIRSISLASTPASAPPDNYDDNNNEHATLATRTLISTELPATCPSLHAITVHFELHDSDQTMAERSQLLHNAVVAGSSSKTGTQELAIYNLPRHNLATQATQKQVRCLQLHQLKFGIVRAVRNGIPTDDERRQRLLFWSELPKVWIRPMAHTLTTLVLVCGNGRLKFSMKGIENGLPVLTTLVMGSWTIMGGAELEWVCSCRKLRTLGLLNCWINKKPGLKGWFDALRVRLPELREFGITAVEGLGYDRYVELEVGFWELPVVDGDKTLRKFLKYWMEEARLVMDIGMDRYVYDQMEMSRCDIDALERLARELKKRREDMLYKN